MPISTTDSGSQDHFILLEACKEFNNYLEENKVQKPASILTDDHSSRFDDSMLEFANSNKIHLFVGSSDTTGVTQRLDQINVRLHS